MLNSVCSAHVRPPYPSASLRPSTGQVKSAERRRWMDAQSTLSQERFMRSRCAFLAQKRLTRNCLSRRIFRQEERKKMGGVRMPKRQWATKSMRKWALHLSLMAWIRKASGATCSIFIATCVNLDKPFFRYVKDPMHLVRYRGDK
jgi:hypothetical protein